MLNTVYSKLPHSAKGGRKAPVTENSSIRSLHAFFSRIVSTAGDNAPVMIRKIVKRLATSNRNRPPMKVSKIVELVKDNGKVALLVGKVLDDERVMKIPAVTIVALSWSKSVQKKIEACGGSIHTLDQFIKIAGSLENIELVKGDAEARLATKYFGPAPGEKNSTTFPRQKVKGKNAEKRIKMKKPISFDMTDLDE